MGKRMKASPTLAEVATRNLLAAREASGKTRLSMREQFKCAKLAADAVATIACLAITAEALGRDRSTWPTQQEYADFWKVNVRHAQRQWALVKQAFPGEDGPDRLAQHLWANWRRDLARRRSDFALSVPAEGLVAPLAP
jgi:hypothetical protein